jgi:hypothetical protein
MGGCEKAAKSKKLFWPSFSRQRKAKSFSGLPSEGLYIIIHKSGVLLFKEAAKI